jgi:hypothetical protein
VAPGRPPASLPSLRPSPRAFGRSALPTAASEGRVEVAETPSAGLGRLERGRGLAAEGRAPLERLAVPEVLREAGWQTSEAKRLWDGLGELRPKGPAGEPVGNLWAAARTRTQSAPSASAAPPAALTVASPAGQKQRRPEKGRGLGQGRGTPELGRQPCRPTASGRLWRLQDPRSCNRPGLFLGSPLQSRLPKVQNIYEVCSVLQAWVPGASERTCPAIVMGSLHRARAAGLGARAGEERVCERAAAEPAPNPRPSATVLGIDGSISAF